MARRIRKSIADKERWNQMVSIVKLMNFAFNAVRIYPANHPEVVGVVAKMHQTMKPLLEELEDIGFGFMEQMLYLEGTMSIEETAANEMLVDRFNRCRVKYLTFIKGVTDQDLHTFFQTLNAEVLKPSEEHPDEILQKKGIQTIRIVEAELEETASKSKLVRKKTLLDWYEKAVSTLSSTQNDLRQDKPVDFKPLYRIIDEMMGAIRNKGYEPYLLLPLLAKGMDPHLCHSVNVAMLSCILGNFYGLNSGQINTLTVCAFLHDAGRLTIPSEWIQRSNPLTPSEREIVQRHSIWGSLWLLSKEELLPQLGLLASRHHLESVGNGSKDGYAPDVFYKILTIADRYDLASFGEKYYWRKHRQDRFLKKMLNHRGNHFDPTIMKLLANCVGFYPVGSLVLLDDGQKGIIVRPNNFHLARPKIYLFESEPLSSPSLTPAESVSSSSPPETPQEAAPPSILNLSETNETGTGFKHSIVSILEPPPEMDIQKLLDEKKEYLLSHAI